MPANARQSYRLGMSGRLIDPINQDAPRILLVDLLAVPARSRPGAISKAKAVCRRVWPVYRWEAVPL